MTYKNITIIFSFILLLCLGITYVKTSSKNSPSQESLRAEKRGTLKQQIATAKSKGESRLNLSGLVGNYEHVKSLDDVLNRYTVLVAEPIEEKSYINEYDSITSWHRFKVLERVSQPATRKSLDFIQPPTDLLPLNDNEILVSRIGGTLLVDGVTINRSEQNFPAFEKANKYLLFVLLDDVTKVGLPELGPAGVLIINENNSLASINGVTLTLEKELKARYGKTLPEIREKLRFSRIK